jgi:pyridoxamine 5'-phosphate oxidase-like protein
MPHRGGAGFGSFGSPDLSPGHRGPLSGPVFSGSAGGAGRPPPRKQRKPVVHQPVAEHGEDRGWPRQSVTYYILDGDRVLISTESKRGKARDVIRDGWASICVMGQEAPYPSVTVEGSACIRTAGIGQATARIFGAISGNQTAPLSDEDLARLDRVILEITCARVYGASHLPAAE